MSEETITILEASILLHKSERTLYRYIEAGKIAATLGPDRKYHLLKSDIVERSERQLTRQIDQTENILLSVQKRLDNVTSMSRQLTRQQEQIDNLEKELALLKEHIEELTSQQKQQPSTPTAPLHRFKVDYDETMAQKSSGPEEALRRNSSAGGSSESGLEPEGAVLRKSSAREVRASSKPQSQKEPLPAGYISSARFANDHGIHENTCRKAIQTGRLQDERGDWIAGKSSVKSAFNLEQQAAFVALYYSSAKFHQCHNPDCPCQQYQPETLF